MYCSLSGMRTCSKCKRDLPLAEFGRNARYADGYLRQCRDCRTNHQRERRQRLEATKGAPPGFQPRICDFCGTEFIPLSGAARYCPDLCHYAKLRLNVARYQKANKDKVRVWSARYRDSPQRKQYLADRAEIIGAQARDWQKRNHESYRAYRNGYMVRRRTKQKLSLEDRRLSTAYRLAIKRDWCFYCGAPGEQDDHYFPVAKGGTDHWYNLVRACWPCNNGKRAHCGTWFMLKVAA